MKFHFANLVFLIVVLTFGCQKGQEGAHQEASVNAKQAGFSVPKIPFVPLHYTCFRTATPLTIDGSADEEAWSNASWTSDFTDIEGPLKPKPRYRTRAKMLWDNEYLYISAEMEEPDIWATLRQRDTVIFYDNDFEIFMDPDGDTHNYYEFEMNAYGTFWDLLLTKPYRDGGLAINAWDIRGARVAVKVYGSINDPITKDEKWTVEIAFPWNILTEVVPGGKHPVEGDLWRINFSRVEWETKNENGKYIVKRDSATGKRLPENNWVWSPQGIINMHYPEMWGFLQFSEQVSGRGEDLFSPDPDKQIKWELRKLYYKQRLYFEREKRYASVLSELGIMNTDKVGLSVIPEIQVTNNMFEITLPGSELDQSWHIRQDGKIWSK